MLSSVAWAQSAAAPGPSLLESLVPFLAIFAIFYFLIIRPNSKRMKEHQNLLANLKRGDNIITNAGIYGRVEGINDNFVKLEVSDGVSIRVVKSQVQSLLKEGAPNV